MKELAKSVFIVARELIRNPDGILKASFCVPSSAEFEQLEAVKEKKMADLDYKKYEAPMNSVLCMMLEPGSEQFSEVAILLKLNLERNEYIINKETLYVFIKVGAVVGEDELQKKVLAFKQQARDYLLKKHITESYREGVSLTFNPWGEISSIMKHGESMVLEMKGNFKHSVIVNDFKHLGIRPCLFVEKEQDYTQARMYFERSAQLLRVKQSLESNLNIERTSIDYYVENQDLLVGNVSRRNPVSNADLVHQLDLLHRRAAAQGREGGHLLPQPTLFQRGLREVSQGRVQTATHH